MREINGRTAQRSKKFAIRDLVDLVGLLEPPKPCLIAFVFIQTLPNISDFLLNTWCHAAIRAALVAMEAFPELLGVIGFAREL
jgi:hypothetical protein